MKHIQDMLSTRTGKLIAGSTLFLVSMSLWLASSIGAPLRFTLEPLSVTPWHFAAAGLLVLLGVLLFLAKSRELAFLPLFFSVYPITYIIMEFLVKNVFGTDYGDYRFKFLTDILFFILEILFFLGFLPFLKDKSPFTPGKGTAEPLFMPKNATPRGKKIRRRVAWFLYAIEMSFVVYLVIAEPIKYDIPMSTVIRLLGFQIVFAVFLGLKEELGFRWILMRGTAKSTGSVVAAILLQAFAWAIYHALFGEGTGTGFTGGLLTVIGGFWFAYLVYEFNTIWPALFSHILIEIYGFYLLYGPVIAG